MIFNYATTGELSVTIRMPVATESVITIVANIAIVFPSVCVFCYVCIIAG